MGHASGDALLKQVSQRLKQSLGTGHTLARVSADEFVVLLGDIESPEQVVLTVENLILKTFRKSFYLQQQLYITSSIGIALFPVDGQERSVLLRNASTAMSRAKQEGRNTYCFYREEMTTLAREQILLENALKVALHEEQFQLVYQPQIDLHTQQWIGLEVLLRWHHPDRGTISPSVFIPIAEQSGLIREIGFWVLKSACHQAKRWLDQGLEFGRIAVNIAGPQLQHIDFINVIREVLAFSRLPAQYLELEVTEGFLMQDIDERIRQLHLFRSMGIQISIDDFGTGYSSLNYLKKLPIDKLKIDQSFVRDIPYDRNDMAIAEAIIALGRALEVRVIAEGIETEDQHQFLKQKGCHEGQGYLYGKAVSAQIIEEVLQTTISLSADKNGHKSINTCVIEGESYHKTQR